LPDIFFNSSTAEAMMATLPAGEFPVPPKSSPRGRPETIFFADPGKGIA
jgi:hypothetical protein